MTSTVEPIRESDQSNEDEAVTRSNSVDWPERSHFSEFDAAIRDALETTASAKDPDASGPAHESADGPTSNDNDPRSA